MIDYFRRLIAKPAGVMSFKASVMTAIDCPNPAPAGKPKEQIDTKWRLGFPNYSPAP
jgi:hypothetical protein